MKGDIKSPTLSLLHTEEGGMLTDIRVLIQRELIALGKEMEMFPDETTLWKTAPGITNSDGNLALHCCGNIKYYIGAVLGNGGYVRNRTLEFNKTSGSREEIISEIQQTQKIVSRVLDSLSEETLPVKYPELVGGVELPCKRFLLHLCSHLAFHTGQVGYLRRILTGQNTSSGAVSVRAIAS